MYTHAQGFREFRYKKSFGIFITWILIMFFMAVPECRGKAVNGKIKIYLKESVSITDRKIFLRDVCLKTSSQAPIYKTLNLGSIELRNNIRVLKISKVKKKYIENRIRRMGFDVDVEGPDEVTFVREGLVLSVDNLKKRLTNYIYTTFGASEKKLKIEFLNKPRSVSLPINTEISQEFLRKKNNGINSIRLVFFNDGEKLSSQNISVRLDSKVAAYVLKRDITHGEILTEKLLDIKELFASKVPRKAMLNPNRYLGWIFKVSANEGSIIKTYQLSEVYAVKQGDLVRIVAENFGIVLHAKGYARKGGKKMDLIPVQNVASGKIVMGKIVGTKIVKVEF